MGSPLATDVPDLLCLPKILKGLSYYSVIYLKAYNAMRVFLGSPVKLIEMVYKYLYMNI